MVLGLNNYIGLFTFEEVVFWAVGGVGDVEVDKDEAVDGGGDGDEDADGVCLFPSEAADLNTHASFPSVS